MTLKDAETFIKSKLSTDNNWATQALIRLYWMQTESERTSEATVIHNGKGFGGTDAPILTSFAKQYISKKWLSVKQMNLLKKKMPKYWRQIYDISDKKKLENDINSLKQPEPQQQLNLFMPNVDIVSNYKAI